MMLRRTYLGLDIRSSSLRAMAIQRHGGHLVLVGGQIEPLRESLLKPDFNALNILDAQGFAATLKKVLEPLCRNRWKVAIALPDRIGQFFVLDIEAPFKSRAEGAEVIRWQVRDLLPEKPEQYALDYQIVDEREAGSKKVFAVVVDKGVVAQYEQVFEQAGYPPSVIDFHSLSLYNAYRSKIDLGDDFILIGLDQGQLSIMVFTARRLYFCRSRQVDEDLRQVYQEINRSLVGCRQQLQGFQRLPVYLHSDWPEQGELFATVDSLFEQSAQLLISPVSKLVNGYQVNFKPEQASGMVAALGAAERMIKGVS